MSKFIALDVGTKRVGVATSDDLAMFAAPHSTIPRSGAAAAIALLAHKENVGRIVVGLPYLPSGGLGSQAKDVNEFVVELQGETTLPIDFENEVLTSVEAENRLKQMGKRRLDKPEIDAMAACIILESYLRRQ